MKGGHEFKRCFWAYIGIIPKDLEKMTLSHYGSRDVWLHSFLIEGIPYSRSDL